MPAAKQPLAPFTILRRDPRPEDVLIEILYCGICHSDVHQARDEWGGATFPMVPGHEIIGRVRQVGADVTRFAVGDLAGVGCIVDSCRIDTISAPHDYNAYLGMVRPFGAMVLLGVPPDAVPLRAGSLIFGNKRLAGSLIGGIKETQEMLDYCGAHQITADLEVIPMEKVNEAYERMLRSDVRYRFVIDLQPAR